MEQEVIEKKMEATLDTVSTVLPFKELCMGVNSLCGEQCHSAPHRSLSQVKRNWAIASEECSLINVTLADPSGEGVGLTKSIKDAYRCAAVYGKIDECTVCAMV